MLTGFRILFTISRNSFIRNKVHLENEIKWLGMVAYAPVIPALWEVETENCIHLEGGGCSEPRLCNCTPAWG